MRTRNGPFEGFDRCYGGGGGGSSKKANKVVKSAGLLAEQTAAMDTPIPPVQNTAAALKAVLAKRRGFLSTVMTPPTLATDNSSNQRTLLGG